MTAFHDISSALDEHLLEMQDVPQALAMPNSEFVPTKGTLFLRPTVLPGDVERATTGTVAHDEYTGIYQIDVIAPAGEGKYESMMMADKIADHFKRGTEFTYKGGRANRLVRCLKASYLPMAADGAWVIVPVQISYYSLTAER